MDNDGTYVSDPSPTRSKVALRLCGEIDVSNAQHLQGALEAGIEEGGPILIDVRELTFIDSTGVHVLIHAAEALSDHGCLVIHGEQRPLSRLLDLLGVDDMVKNLHRVHRDQERTLKEQVPFGRDEPDGGALGEPPPGQPRPDEGGNGGGAPIPGAPGTAPPAKEVSRSAVPSWAEGLERPTFAL